jgi:hypothetical protein
VLKSHSHHPIAPRQEFHRSGSAPIWTVPQTGGIDRTIKIEAEWRTFRRFCAAIDEPAALQIWRMAENPE